VSSFKEYLCHNFKVPWITLTFSQKVGTVRFVETSRRWHSMRFNSENQANELNTAVKV